MNSNHFNIHRLILSLLAALHHQNTCYVSFVCVLMIMHMHTYKSYSLKFSRVKFCGFWNSTYVTLIILSSSTYNSKQIHENFILKMAQFTIPQKFYELRKFYAIWYVHTYLLIIIIYGLWLISIMFYQLLAAAPIFLHKISVIIN